MEHIIKETQEETIKRYELNGKSIWLVRKNNWYGIGDTKKQAEKNVSRYQFATNKIPFFLYQMGTKDKNAKQYKLYAVPAFSYINSFISFTWQGKYNFKVILENSTGQICLMVQEYKLDSVPVYFTDIIWSGEQVAGITDQIKHCLFQFYIELDKGLVFKKQNQKLGEWNRNWYNKLQTRRLG